MGSYANVVLSSHVIPIETGEKVVQRKNNTFFYPPRFMRLDYILWSILYICVRFVLMHAHKHWYEK